MAMNKKLAPLAVAAALMAGGIGIASANTDSMIPADAVMMADSEMDAVRGEAVKTKQVIKGGKQALQGVLSIAGAAVVGGAALAAAPLSAGVSTALLVPTAGLAYNGGRLLGKAGANVCKGFGVCR